MSIEDFFSSTCQIRVRDGSDEYGEPTGFTLGAAKTCRIDPRKSSIGVDEEGKNIIVDGFVYLLPVDAPDKSDELVVDGEIFRILEVVKQRELADPHHVKVAVRKEPL